MHLNGLARESGKPTEKLRQVILQGSVATQGRDRLGRGFARFQGHRRIGAPGGYRPFRRSYLRAARPRCPSRTKGAGELDSTARYRIGRRELVVFNFSK